MGQCKENLMHTYLQRLQVAIMWTLYIFSYIILNVPIGSSNILLKTADDIKNHFTNSECAVKILKYLTEDGPKTLTVKDIDNDMGAELLRVEGITIVSKLDVKIDIYVVMSEEFEDFKKKIINLANNSYWQPRSYFIISIEKLFNKENLTEFLKSHNIFYVSIILKSLENFEIYSFNAELDNCNRPKNLKLMMNCFLFNKSRIFVKYKPKKFNNCHVKFACHDYLPYSGIHRKINEIGFEEYILKLIQEKESIKIDMIQFNTTQIFGQYQNGSFNGLLGMVQNREVEGVVGGFYLKLTHAKTFDHMYPYLLDNIIMVVPLATPLSTWEAVLTSVSFTTGFLIILFFAIFFFAAISLNIFRNDRKDLTRDFLMVYGYFFNNIIHTRFKSILSHRLIILNMLLFVFFMCIAIQSSVLSVTTKPINTYQIKDINLIKQSYYPVTIKAVVNNDYCGAICDSVLDCITKVYNSRYKNKKYYTLVSAIAVSNEKWRLGFNEKDFGIYVLDENFYLMLQTIYLYRGSTITPVLEKYYRHIFHGGVLRHYKKIIDHKLMLKDFYGKPLKRKAGTLKNLKGAFVLLLCGYCMSIIAFIFEIVQKKFNIFRIKQKK